MTTFDTPEPILATIEIAVGQIQINAGDRADTTVDVRPSDPAHDRDVEAARQVQVDYANGRLSVVTPRRALRSLVGRPGSVDVVVELPTGSRVHVKSVGSIHSTGQLGESRFIAGAGSVRLDQVGRVSVRTGAGDVEVGEATGPADIVTGTGRVRVDKVAGSVTVKSANGTIDIGTADGDARLKSANGDITVEWAGTAVAARTAAGNIRIGEAESGSVVAETGFGELEIGIKPGVAAWIDARSKFGQVRSDLDPADEPEPGADKVEIRAHTGFGDILVHHSTPVG